MKHFLYRSSRFKGNIFPVSFTHHVPGGETGCVPRILYKSYKHRIGSTEKRGPGAPYPPSRGRDQPPYNRDDKVPVSLPDTHVIHHTKSSYLKSQLGQHLACVVWFSVKMQNIRKWRNDRPFLWRYCTTSVKKGFCIF